MMNQETIRQQIRDMTMSFSSEITDKVVTFLQTFVQPIWKENPRLHVPAAAAIIGQITKLPTIDNSSFTGTGIKIENVMRHLKDVRKETFLDAIDFQLSRWPHDHHALSEKVQHTKISLRTFKKYKEIFEYLAVRNHKECVPATIRQDLLAFFWIIFLLLKHSLEALENISLSTKILVVLLEEIFCSTLCKLPTEMVRQYLYESQNFPMVGQIEQFEKATYLKEYKNIFTTTLTNRNAVKYFSREELKNNETLLKRLIDDLSNIYDKDFEKLPQGRHIQEISYLELSKNLTPQAFRIKKLDDVKPIVKILNFDEDSDQDTNKNEDSISYDLSETNKKTPIMRQPIQEPIQLFSAPSFGNLLSVPSKPRQIQSMSSMTPLTSGMVRNAWVNEIVQEGNPESENKLRQIFAEKHINFQEFKRNCVDKISQQVETLTSHAIDKTSQKSSIWKFFISVTSKYLQKSSLPKQNTIMFIRAFLCLSGSLFNFGMRSLTTEFQKYCKIYELDLLNGFRAIYEFGKHIDAPNFIKEYLYQLEKQVIIKQVWDCECGYKLLKTEQNQNNSIIFKRLHRHVYGRIEEICQSLHIQASLVKKIDNLYREVLEKKVQLLEKNKLDQIIMCCIVACLTINEDKYYEALGSIFFKYNFISKSTISDMTCPSGDEANLFDYYNRVFLPSIQDMMGKSSNTQYLFSPIRKSKLQKFKQGKNSLPPISKMFGNSPFVTGGPSMRLGGSDYQKRSLNVLKKSLGESPNAEQKESPHFGIPLKRTMTFGNGQL